MDSTYTLNNGIKIPILGLGTWDLNGDTAVKAVKWAVEAGYRLIDTAQMYGNESAIGKAIKEVNIDREDLFITSKVWESNFGPKSTIRAFERSLEKLGLSYLDLYLIHWPQNNRMEAWKTLEKIYEEGKVRAIGVSNYTIRHLEELFEKSNLVPAVNQVEFSPFLYQKELLSYCKKKDIRVEAYSPLTRTRKFDNPILKEISTHHDKTPAQVLIRWGLQHGIVEIPKSSSKIHIIENSEVFDFELDDVEMAKLNDLDEGFRVTYDPETIK